jgi:hypothetical protein
MSFFAEMTQCDKDKSFMQPDMRRRFAFCLGIVFLLVQNLEVLSANPPPRKNLGLFFSQGLAISSPLDPAKSRNTAVQDFLAQAIVQAAATLLQPGQLRQKYKLIQEKILKQPDRYVLGYELFSENADQEGLYRITGQVTVSMDALNRDLMVLEEAYSETEASQPLSSPSEEQSVESTEGSSEPEKSAETSEKASAPEHEILWVVSEKWKDRWRLAGGEEDSDGFLAAGVSQASQAYGWSIRFPQGRTIAPDNTGGVSRDKVLAQAKALGLHYVVIGSVGLIADQGDETRLVTRLNLLNVSSGRTQGEIRKEMVMGDLSYQEAAIEIASFAVPQIDRRLRDTSRPVPAIESTPSSGEPGELELRIESSDAYADWLVLEKILHEQFKNLQVKGLEIGPEMIVVRILGADSTGLMNLDKTRLPNELEIRIASLGDGKRSFSISLMKPEVNPAEPR